MATNCHSYNKASPQAVEENEPVKEKHLMNAGYVCIVTNISALKYLFRLVVIITFILSVHKFR